jgi:non-canonical poly(A) RNA polymerase PAPD5/7
LVCVGSLLLLTFSRLHKEILDFYAWVKPKPHEEQVRQAVFERLDKSLQKMMPGELKAFGSYAAGLYLPTADMDLVFLTRNFVAGRGSKAQSSKLVYSVAKSLRNSGIAIGPVVPIGKAKVPIIKFVDKLSGLKIDLSFDNDTGLVAIDTFHKWKKENPCLPIIVSVIKQFLMIRALNDVSTGGLGGFSTICLVTSLLQHLPVTHTPTNLGDVLLEFFNCYGNIFDRKLTIIRLDPPGYVDKVHTYRLA